MSATTISQCDASARVQYFQQNANNSTYLENGGAKAFTMSAQDIQEMSEYINAFNTLVPALGVNAVRFYMAQHNTDPYLGEYCLIMVPVLNFVANEDPAEAKGGEDLLETLTVTRTDGEDPIEIKPLCFDFTFPCPQTCPENNMGLPFNLEQYNAFSCTYTPPPPKKSVKK